MAKRIAIGAGVLVLLLAGYVALAIWRMPGPYELNSARVEYPLMPWEDYPEAAASAEIPIIVEAGGSGAALLFFGATHSNDPSHPQFAALDAAFARFEPSVVMVEGRPDPLFPAFIDPTENNGESGRLLGLAQGTGAKAYIWELSREEEARLLGERFTAEQVAIFLLMRPFSGAASAAEAEERLSAIIDDRGGRPGIEGVIANIEQFDAAWSANIDTGEDWRDLNGVYGAPGFVGEMFEYANDIRDQNMLNIVRELLEQDERVMVTMGWSHTVRIEGAVAELPVSAN